MSIVYLALGSNVGDRLGYIQWAVAELENCGLEVLKVSRVVETEPMEAPPQEWFLNAVLKARTDHSPEELILKHRPLSVNWGASKEYSGGRGSLTLIFYCTMTLNWSLPAYWSLIRGCWNASLSCNL